MNLKIDDYAHLDSLMHRWDPRLKLIGLMLLIFSFASIETLNLVPPMIAVTAMLFGLSRLPLSFLRRRLRYPGFFLLGIVVLLPWLSGETVLWQWGGLSLRLEGLKAVGLIGSRFLCILTVALVLLGTMPFLTTIKAMRSLGLPPLFADMTLLSYRYLYEVTDNLTTMRRAMKLRGFGQGDRHRHAHSHDHSHNHPSRRHSGRHSKSSQRRLAFVPNLRELNLLASLTGSLFIRSYEKSEHVYNAMRLRGYGQSPTQTSLTQTASQKHKNASRVLPPAAPLSSSQNWLLLTGILAIALALFLAQWWW